MRFVENPRFGRRRARGLVVYLGYAVTVWYVTVGNLS